MTTVVAVFQGQNKADEALTALRSELDGQNIAILVRSEQQSGGVQSGTPEGMNGFTQEALNLTSSAGNLMFRTLAFTANTMLTMPLRIMAPMAHSMTGAMGNTTGAGNCRCSEGMQGSTGGGMAGDMPGGMGGNMSGAQSGSQGGGMGGTQGEKVEITLQGEGELKGVADILQSHGAVQVHTYTA